MPRNRKFPQKKIKKKNRLPVPAYFKAWLLENYETDPDQSVEKNDMYIRYVLHCVSLGISPKKMNIFGRYLLDVIPSAYSRRLTAGKIKKNTACYGGIRSKLMAPSPILNQNLNQVISDRFYRFSADDEDINFPCDVSELPLELWN